MSEDKDYAKTAQALWLAGGALYSILRKAEADADWETQAALSQWREACDELETPDEGKRRLAVVE